MSGVCEPSHTSTRRTSISGTATSKSAVRSVYVIASATGLRSSVTRRGAIRPISAMQAWTMSWTMGSVKVFASGSWSVRAMFARNVA